MVINLDLYSNSCAVPHLCPLFIPLPASSSLCGQHLPCPIAVRLLSLTKHNSSASELVPDVTVHRTNFSQFFQASSR